jgi:hypothetical protein
MRWAISISEQSAGFSFAVDVCIIFSIFCVVASLAAGCDAGVPVADIHCQCWRLFDVYGIDRVPLLLGI